MLTKINIQNFKSVRRLEFDAKRVNLFIGEPNTGKSNIVEALAFLSEGVLGYFGEVFRVKTATDLFFDHKVGDGMQIQADQLSLSLTPESGRLDGVLKGCQGAPRSFSLFDSGQMHWPVGYKTFVRYYLYKDSDAFSNVADGILNPPFGDNLVTVLHSNEVVWQRIDSIVRSKGFRLEVRPTESALAIAKEVAGKLYSYPWRAISETLRRIIFFMAVLETNRDCTLLLDEPEAHTFPFYTKYFAEQIALDETNQFFITTHNPYLLSSIVEKTTMKDLAVFVTRMEDFDTKLDMIPEKRLPELLELGPDAFFNLEKLVTE